MNLQTFIEKTWCSGCGNYAILSAFISAIKELRIKPEKIVVVSGIGCHGRMSDYINVNSFHTIHGRVIPLATGIKLANPELVVVGFSGDGDAYSIGLGHLPHAARRNIDITLLVHNNQVFGLTTGQYTPTSPKGFKSRSTPYGSLEEPLNPLLLALASGATFVARGFAGDISHLKILIKEAIKHKGFAIIDVLQPCVTYYNTYQYYRQKVYKLENHDPTDLYQAIKKAMEWNDKIPIGILYKIHKETLDEHVKKPLIRIPETGVDVKNLYRRFR